MKTCTQKTLFLLLILLAGIAMTACMPIQPPAAPAAPAVVAGVDKASMEEVGVVLEVDFTYNFATADEYIAAVSPLAPKWAAVPGLVWKVWILNPETKRAGAVYYFESAKARQAYLDSELAAAVAGNQALSDFRVAQYDVMHAESLVTHAPLTGASENMDKASMENIGVVLEVDFTYNFATADEYIAPVSPLAPKSAAVPGLVWKVWILNPETKRAGAVYYFESAKARQAYLDSELAAAVAGNQALSDFRVAQYQIMAEETAITHGPVGISGSE